MQYARARVALTLAYTMPRDILPVELELCRVHLGHARTLLLGSLIAKEYGCPFHVRMDGARVDVPDRGGPIIDTMQCLLWLGVDFDWTYWAPQVLPTPEIASRYMDADAFQELVWTCGAETGAIVAALDDAMSNHPSVIVRGSEFTFSGQRHGAVDPGGPHESLLRMEKLVYAMLDRKRTVVTVPMLMFEGAKMSKSGTQFLHWSLLQQASPEQARDFLVATVICPEDPLSVLGLPFSVDGISPDPYVWNWEHWTDMVRRSV